MDLEYGSLMSLRLGGGVFSFSITVSLNLISLDIFTILSIVTNKKVEGLCSMGWGLHNIL